MKIQPGEWCSEIGFLVSLNAPELHTSSDAREPISQHQAVFESYVTLLKKKKKNKKRLSSTNNQILYALHKDGLCLPVDRFYFYVMLYDSNIVTHNLGFYFQCFSVLI